MAHNYEAAEHDDASNSKKVTVVGGSISAAGQVTITPLQAWPDPKTYIGLVTITGSLAPAAGNITLDAGSQTQIKGNLTLSDSKGFIGLTTTVLGSAPTIFAVVNTAAAGQSSVVLDNSIANIGFATVRIASNVNTNIGLVTIDGGRINTITAVTDITNPVAIKGNITLSDPKGFIGLVTAMSRNAGTSKTLIGIPITLSTASQLTIAVPATNLSIYVTSVLINSDATVRVSIKSGVTYLTGNASIGITLNPGGGWVETGSPDAPVYISTPSASINVEKFDMTATKANVGGKIKYFTE